MPTFPETWTIYTQAAGGAVTLQAVFTAGESSEGGTVTATGQNGPYSGTWSETFGQTGNQVSFSLTAGPATGTYQFNGLRVAYAMGGNFTGPASGGWSACAAIPVAAQQELD